ncbi:hypothetical protein B7P43_G05323 [Cryptotermes secundus]|uniref:Uncharacterized protein n=1 Tax=Cryptotermes secundus TaxID=105785 RepID=A0A2J7RFW2_9NEOP|nr:hypothetical protein B7P43_G05323 [Cryptotermes secundus]
MIVPIIDLGMGDGNKHLNRKKHTEYTTPTLSGTCYAASLDVSYQVYQRECWDFKQLQLRNEKRWKCWYLQCKTQTASLTQVACIPTVANGQQKALIMLWYK